MPHYAALLLPSVVPAYLEDGSYNFRFPNNLLNGNHNPIASARDNIRKRPQFNLFASAWVRLNITDWARFPFGHLAVLHHRPGAPTISTGISVRDTSWAAS